MAAPLLAGGADSLVPAVYFCAHTARLSFYADLFGLCDRGHHALWRVGRALVVGWAGVAVQPFISRRV